jgi:hypothetical protein
MHHQNSELTGKFYRNTWKELWQRAHANLINRNKIHLHYTLLLLHSLFNNNWNINHVKFETKISRAFRCFFTWSNEIVSSEYHVFEKRKSMTISTVFENPFEEIFETIFCGKDEKVKNMLCTCTTIQCVCWCEKYELIWFSTQPIFQIPLQFGGQFFDFRHVEQIHIWDIYCKTLVRGLHPFPLVSTSLKSP